MIEAILNDPEKLSIVAGLIAAVVALVRGTVIPGGTHDRIVKELKDKHAEHIATIRDNTAQQLATIRENEALWKQIAFRGVTLSEQASLTSLELAAKQRALSPREG